MIEAGEIQKMIGEAVVKNAPRVSIITPAYNSAEFIAETLQSVFAQTFRDYEIIVCNDGSPDTFEFEKKIAPFLDRIVYLKQENRGAGAARNAAIEHSRARVLAFLDADDVWLPEYLEKQIAFLDAGDYDLVYADAEFFGEGNLRGKTYMQTAPSNGAANFDSILDLRCNLITSGTMARKKAVLDAGMFEREKVRAHDFVLWLKMARRAARIGYRRDVLLKYRVHAGNLSGDAFRQIEREIDVFRRVGKIFDLNAEQTKCVEKHSMRLEAAMEIERGKCFLLQKKYDSAQSAFRRANEFRHSLKLQIVIWLTLFAPGLLLKFYKHSRAGEIEFLTDVFKHI